jgi:hypothetical protein
VDEDNFRSDKSRRSFVSVVTIAGVGLMLRGSQANAQQPAAAGGKSKPSDVNATEDLMREHGVLNRVLLV